MKKNIYIIALLLLWSIWLVSGVNQTSAASLSDTRAQVIELPSGDKFVQKIDKIAEKIAKKAKNDDNFRRKITEKISAIQSKYQNKTDSKSKKIAIIFSYLELKVSSQLGIADSRILERLQKVESDKVQNRATSRINKIKQKKYQRIHIKK